MKPPRNLLPATLLLAALFPAAAADYYVDAQRGDDARSGTSHAEAWRTLERVNEQIFQPGDRLLFKAGTSCRGQLAPRGSGTEEKPIRIDKYDEGRLPRLDGEGRVRDTLLLRNVEYWEVRNLEITNQGAKREPGRTGVHVLADDFGPMRRIHLRHLFVHDVNGDLRKSHEGCGIFFETRGRGAFFDDFLVEDCHLVRTDRNGICQKNGSGPHSTRVVIRRNLLEDIGGDGIKPWGSDAPLVEHNVVRGGRMRCQDAAAGIWPFDCNDALIQFNEVSGMKGSLDGQGFDADYLCRRTVIQFNYSHDNEGGFILICTPGSSYNDGTVVRDNISQNDGIDTARVFQFAGGPTNTLVANNTIYVGPRQNLPLLLFNEWDRGVPDGVKFFNNIFYVDGRVRYVWGPARNVVFADNIFYGRGARPPSATSAISTRPPLRAPGTGKDGFNSLAGYVPQGGDFPRGQVVPGSAGRDFFGRPVPAGRPPTIGAVEAP
jgi:hypothetical protein